MDRRYLRRVSRYLDGQEQLCNETLRQLDADSWFDYWHMHPDGKGRGDRARGLVDALTCRLLQQAERLMAHRGDGAQVWAVLEESTGDNAVFIHSENPNGSDFPDSFARVDWRAETPAALAALIEPAYQAGRLVHQGGVCWFIRRR